MHRVPQLNLSSVSPHIPCTKYSVGPIQIFRYDTEMANSQEQNKEGPATADRQGFMPISWSKATNQQQDQAAQVELQLSRQDPIGKKDKQERERKKIRGEECLTGTLPLPARNTPTHISPNTMFGMSSDYQLPCY